MPLGFDWPSRLNAANVRTRAALRLTTIEFFVFALPCLLDVHRVGIQPQPAAEHARAVALRLRLKQLGGDVGRRRGQRRRITHGLREQRHCVDRDLTLRALLRQLGQLHLALRQPRLQLRQVLCDRAPDGLGEALGVLQALRQELPRVRHGRLRPVLRLGDLLTDAACVLRRDLRELRVRELGQGGRQPLHGGLHTGDLLAGGLHLHLGARLRGSIRELLGLREHLHYKVAGIRDPLLRGGRGRLAIGDGRRRHSGGQHLDALKEGQLGLGGLLHVDLGLHRLGARGGGRDERLLEDPHDRRRHHVHAGVPERRGGRGSARGERLVEARRALEQQGIAGGVRHERLVPASGAAKVGQLRIHERLDLIFHVVLDLVRAEEDPGSLSGSLLAQPRDGFRLRRHVGRTFLPEDLLLERGDHLAQRRDLAVLGEERILLGGQVLPARPAP
mmetsp:Transcript_67372/g.217535  ORF Transcript_67372/g.217535 Transcript_67372/m.217535 type:complete len:446 (+) Transcript_67372:235-1572(+)